MEFCSFVISQILKAGYQEAWFYWLQTVKTLNDDDKSN
jgi:hypothetical protein